jgi:hypothetical protein
LKKIILSVFVFAAIFSYKLFAQDLKEKDVPENVKAYVEVEIIGKDLIFNEKGTFIKEE